MTDSARILVVDNYDSFVYTIVGYLKTLGATVTVVRNDAIDPSQPGVIDEYDGLIGVQRAQISRIENGKNLTFSTIARVFKAMGISAKLEIRSIGQVALW